MLPGGEQPQQKRRSKANTGGQDPLPLMYPKAKQRATTSTQNNAYPLDDNLAPRPSTNVVRYNQPPGMQPQPLTDAQQISTVIPPRRQQGTTRGLPPRQVRTTISKPPPINRPHKNVHWLLPLGVGMVVTLLIWVVGASSIAWGLQRYNDIRYGVPRTSQIDYVVGHGGDNNTHPSHFIAVNLNRQAVVIELMAGDPAKSVSYVAPVYILGDGGDLAPITLEFRDVAGNTQPDMIIHIHLPNQDQLSVFVNDGSKFRPPNPNDKIHL